MAEQIEKLVRFVAETRWEDIPRAVQQHARLVLLDTFGVMLAGAEQSDVRRMQQGQKASAGTGATVYTRGWPTTDPGRAALLNALAARSLELGEVHVEVSSQGAVQIVPGALAVAEAGRRSGRELLTALVVGYDFAIRVGAATTRRPLAHPTGQAALLGAIAAGARLRGLNAADTSTAVRIGANLMVTGSYTNVVAGATALNVGGGMSGLAATLAPDLAIAGFTAQQDAIEQSMESVVGDGFDPSGLLDELGTRWEIQRNFFRLRACCNPICPALDALEDALAALRPKPDEIERIDVATYRFAAGMRNQDPPSYFGAKYSLPHAAAALVINGHLRYESFTEAMVHDPVVAALRHRVHMTEDPEMSAALPRLKPARVTLTLKDGRHTTHTSEDDRRMGQPCNEAEIREKFRALAGLVLTPQGVASVEAAIDDCEHWTGVDPLIEPLRRYGLP
ncbi:MAG: prpD [Betaproteobacteria bacterium]|nr:prpD [Betaproteobacteria bacterium]